MHGLKPCDKGRLLAAPPWPYSKRQPSDGVGVTWAPLSHTSTQSLVLTYQMSAAPRSVWDILAIEGSSLGMDQDFVSDSTEEPGLCVISKSADLSCPTKQTF